MNWNYIDLDEGPDLSQEARALLSGYRRVEELRAPLLSTSNQTIRHFRCYGEDAFRACYFSISVPAVRGGTYDNPNLGLFKKAITEACLEERAVYVLYLRTGGVRITHDRTIFDPIWGIMPELFRLRKKHLLVTIADEKCLGAGAVFFAQGTFRLTSAEDTLLNLTGPSIIKKFYGDADKPQLEYKDYASAGHQWQTNELIQEAYRDFDSVVARLNGLLHFLSYRKSKPQLQHLSALQKKDRATVFPKALDEHHRFLEVLCDDAFEIFPELSQVGKTYLMKKNHQLFGAILQPLKNPENVINRAMVRRYEMALQVFRTLGLPLVSGIDSPGGDPRQVESDRDILLASIDLVEKLVEYPHPKLGLLLKRSFGGSGMFALPPSHGSLGFLALEDSSLGIMSDSLLDRVVQSKPSLRADWEETKSKHLPRLQDLINFGTIDKTVSLSELAYLIDGFLGGAPVEASDVSARIN